MPTRDGDTELVGPGECRCSQDAALYLEWVACFRCTRLLKHCRARLERVMTCDRAKV